MKMRERTEMSKESILSFAKGEALNKVSGYSYGYHVEAEKIIINWVGKGHGDFMTCSGENTCLIHSKPKPPQKELDKALVEFIENNEIQPFSFNMCFGIAQAQKMTFANREEDVID